MPMEAKGIEPATEALDDIVYVCLRCGTETKRTVKRSRFGHRVMRFAKSCNFATSPMDNIAPSFLS